MIGELRSGLRYCSILQTDQSLATEIAAAGREMRVGPFNNRGKLSEPPWEFAQAIESKMRLRPEGDHEYNIGRSRARGSI